jgi:hypothetical protein
VKTVHYFCHSCMKKSGDRPVFADFVLVTVRDRREKEDIKDYTQEVARIVGTHHSHRNCSQNQCALMLPVNNEKGIGY